MSARVAKHMSLARASVLVFVVVALLTAAFMWKMTQGEAMPANETDQTAVPHYFGPWPNWALSPLTQSNAAVEITGVGTGAKAVATVDPLTGGIASVDVTSPGSGYTTAPDVTITGGTGATATATVSSTGGVVGFTNLLPGAGYKAFDVVLSGDGAGAAAVASGGVDHVAVGDGGSGYTFPTVDFDLPDDPNGTIAKAHATMNANGTITAVVVDNPGSGYSTAPGVAIHNGTLGDPIAGATLATTVTATLKLTAINVVNVGAGYTAATVTVNDPTGPDGGSGAGATATVDSGAVTAITLDAPAPMGSGYLTAGIKKFQDQLPGLYVPNGTAPAAAKYIPLAVPEPKTYNGVPADEYEIAVVQYRTTFNSDLPATLARGYVQLETASWLAEHPNKSLHWPVVNANLDPTKSDEMPTDAQGNPLELYAVTPPQWLGPVISATKNKPVRVVFHNLLPKGAEGDLFLPTDSTLMGSGMGPMGMAAPQDLGTVMDEVRNPVCSEYPKSADCFKDNRATLHLHGGTSPWISDGTPHQWITPAGEDTPWPEGVSVENVPDMNVGNDPRDGVQTFYYTNQQSARLMFYHDHSWGITRLNVYAGEAAGYLITDDTEKALVNSGTIPAAADTIPLVVQDRTFVPDDAQLALQDPTWNAARWGTKGNFWYHHVYMPAQNPGDPSGMSAYGRWMFGPWFWPPATSLTTPYMPIDNPYYDVNCKLDVPSTWQYQTDPFCEPQKIPGTPNISVGMEQFNDTPIVNGVAYPTITLEPKTYRLRMLNAANDRFFNFQWYVADPTQGNGKTEVALDPTMLAAAQTDPVVSPNAVTSVNVAGAPVDLTGPDWIQIGTEGGFLPAPVVVDGQQVTTWITDPTRFDVGNVDKHSLLLAPAERADVIVDFKKFAGKTLILYNDAPAAFPARVPSYDYYTGAPDLSPNGAPGVLPGYGPNTRTIMQVKIDGPEAPAAFDLAKLNNAFKHNANRAGVFESGQHPIIVGQAAYNSAYGTSFASGANCNPVPNTPNPAFQVCDGFVRINDTSTFGFNTLKSQTAKVMMPLEPKAIHDEMNSTTFDEYGRMQANLGVEAQPPAPGAQNVVLYPYVNPATELIDGTNLPKVKLTDANGNPVSDFKIAPMSDPKDGTQIWRITHNGVDTHPIHFHLYDVQIVNRVTWDNIIIPTEPGELGWKDTIRVSPLEDTIVALRPVIPDVPFEVPNAIRNLSPELPTGADGHFNNVDPQGNPTTAIANKLVNFGWEYVYHCHILSHEEMDMMRPVSLAVPPKAPSNAVLTRNGSTVTVTFNDNSIAETSYQLQRTADSTTWTNVGTPLPSPLDQLNGTRIGVVLTNTGVNPNTVYGYRVAALNTVGYGAEFPQMTVQSTSNLVTTGGAPNAPSLLAGALGAGPQINLTWLDNAANENGFAVQRSTNGGAFTQIAAVPAKNNSGTTVTWADTAIAAGTTYTYRVAAFNGAGVSAPTNTVSVIVPPAPAVPSTFTATTANGNGNNRTVTLNWTAGPTPPPITGYTIQRATNAAFTTGLNTVNVDGTVTTTLTQTGLTRNTTYYYRIRANNGFIPSAWKNLPSITTNP